MEDRGFLERFKKSLEERFQDLTKSNHQFFNQKRYELVSIIWWAVLIVSFACKLAFGLNRWSVGIPMIGATLIVLISDLYDIIQSMKK